MDKAVTRELWEQYRKSMQPKVWLLVITIGAILVNFGLDHIRKEFTNFHDKPYTAKTLMTVVQDIPELKEAAGKLEAAQPRFLREPQRWEKLEDALKALLANTDEPRRLLEAQRTIR